VEGAANNGTAIDDNGLLSVAEGESAETLTVRAASKADPGKSDTAEVTVTKPVQGIAITTPPDKITYGQGEELNLDGLTVTVTFTDSTTEIVAAGNLAVTGYDKNKPGPQTVTVTYGGKTASFEVTVTAAGTGTGAYLVGQGYDTLEAAVSAAAGTTAVITLMSDISLSSSITVSAANTNITLTGSGTKRIIPSEEPNYTFFILEGSGVSLTLDKGVTLDKDATGQSGSVVRVRNGAALVLKNEAKITGNSTSGVSVERGGIFTMQGGEITGNTADGNGGGVRVADGGTFIMQGGKIWGNTANSTGGGVYNAGTFTMQGGEITENTANFNGGGVYNFGIFTMQGGKIAENTAGGSTSHMGGGVYNAGTFTMRNSSAGGNDSLITNNYVKSSSDIAQGNRDYECYIYGGGVYVAANGTFIMESGSIEGNRADANVLRWSQHSYSDYVYVKGGGVYNAGTFTMQGGEITDSRLFAALDPENLYSYDKYACAYGGGVYLDSGSAITKTGGTIEAGYIDLRCSNGDTGGAAVFVEYTDNPVGLENDVEAAHRLTKASNDDEAGDLTVAKGWTE
jgi:hypothetical protein